MIIYSTMAIYIRFRHYFALQRHCFFAFFMPLRHIKMLITLLRPRHMLLIH